MFKKIKMAIFISCISASSYAYVINADLSIENKTNTPFIMTMQQPNGQDAVTLNIPAHATIPFSTSNGDNSGWLYQTTVSPFKLIGAEDNKVHAQGRIAFYVGASTWNRYSFMDGISSSDGFTIDPFYSCKNGSDYTTFKNKLIIDNNGNNASQLTEFPRVVTCQGLKSSVLSNHNQLYYPTCFDGEKPPLFWRYFDGEICKRSRYGRHSHEECYLVFGYTNGTDDYAVEHTEDPVALRAALDRRVGNRYCETWS